MVAGKSKTQPILIDGADNTPVVFTPVDFDRFVMSQREVLDAARSQEERNRRQQEVGEQFAALVYRVSQWCKDHPVLLCVACPRIDDLLIVVVASDEDPGGVLHDSLSDLDLDMFEKNGLRIAWLLLRASEASGLGAFVGGAHARTIFDASTKPAP